MNNIDSEIAKKIIAYVQNADGWKWVPKAHGCNAWMAKGSLLVKAVRDIGPSEPWNYLCIYIGEKQWDVPAELRKKVWEAASPIFERVRLNAQAKEKQAMLSLI